MSEPHVAQKAPFVITLEPGTYYWCACGKSAKQPFCNGSHKGTAYSPKPVEIAEEKKLVFCGCKHSKNPPFCDGTHKSM
jgi:CDGSH iron-sulfur domain-containing protein 3